MNIIINENGVWYHSSNRRLKYLRKVSTVTQWRELAEAFSHKPKLLKYDDDGAITHNGKKSGYLYIIDEPVKIEIDIYPYPRTTMDANAEILTARRLKIKLISKLNK